MLVIAKPDQPLQPQEGHTELSPHLFQLSGTYLETLQRTWESQKKTVETPSAVTILPVLVRSTMSVNTTLDIKLNLTYLGLFIFSCWCLKRRFLEEYLKMREFIKIQLWDCI